VVEPGQIDPDQVITPGIYVKRLVKGERSRRPRQGSRWGDDWEVRRWWERRPDAADPG